MEISSSESLSTRSRVYLVLEVVVALRELIGTTFATEALVLF